MNNPNSEQIDEIVAMLDEFMSGNGGHMNIQVDNHIHTKKVTTLNSSECAGQNLACHVPTLFEGLDQTDPD